MMLVLLSAVSAWPDTVVTISLEFDPEEWAFACAHPDQEILVDAALSSGSLSCGCTMQIRGQSSSYYPKKSIKVRLAPGFLLHGFDELNLNTEYTDRSRIRENLSYLFHEYCGQIVPFVAMTEVVYNGATQGPYLFVEDVDGDFALRTWLPDDAVIYKCREYGSSLNSPHVLNRYLKKTFEDLPTDDLEWLIRWLLTCPDSVFVGDLAGRTHFDALLDCIAANTLLGHGSTYYHNYHMVLDAPGTFGRWRMVPWDMDKTWGSAYGTDLPYYWVTNDSCEPNVLLYRLWAIPHLRELILERLEERSSEFLAWSAGGVIDSLAALAQPLVQVDPFRDYSMAQFEASVDVIRNWPAARLSALEEMLASWPLPFLLHPTEQYDPDEILATWSDAERSSRYRVSLSTDSTFLDESAVFWETETGDTSILIHDPGAGPGSITYLQVRAYNTFREERALNRSVRLAPSPVVARTGSIVINEVFYRNGDLIAPDDWVELYNAGAEAVDLGGWAFRDTQDRNLHVISDIVLDPGAYLVLRQNPEAFINTYRDCNADPDPFQFGLSAEGEILRLYDHLGNQVDYVPYLPFHPWPSEPADGGWSLALSSPERDNSDPASWTAIPDGGTPGLSNSSDPPWTPDYTLDLFSLHPNPATSFASASVLVYPGGACVLRVFDLAGREAMPPLELDLNAGTHSVAVEVEALPSGVYFLQISYAGMQRALRFIKTGGAP